MIVKVVPRDSDTALARSHHFDVGEGPIRSGVHYFDKAPGERSYVDFRRALAYEQFAMHVVDEATEPHPQVIKEPNDPLWVMYFASWWASGVCHIALTSGRIFLMANNGETIDRLG